MTLTQFNINANLRRTRYRHLHVATSPKLQVGKTESCTLKLLIIHLKMLSGLWPCWPAGNNYIVSNVTGQIVEKRDVISLDDWRDYRTYKMAPVWFVEQRGIFKSKQHKMCLFLARVNNQVNKTIKRRTPSSYLMLVRILSPCPTSTYMVAAQEGWGAQTPTGKYPEA